MLMVLMVNAIEGTKFTSPELCEPFTHTMNRMVNGKQPVFQNNEMAAMLVSQTNLLGVVLFSYVNALFCPNKLAQVLVT